MYEMQNERGNWLMTRWIRSVGLGMTAVLLSAALSGCGTGFTLNPQDLYSLPRLPSKYDALNQCLRTISNNGAEYAAPTSGANIQAVQMVDLDGDGQEEAVAFFRNTGDEKPLKIYVFAAENEAYRQIAEIEGSGTAIYSISYRDLDGDGKMELLVGWRVSTDLQALSVYSLQADGAVELMRTNYVKYAVTDLEQDSLLELVVLRSNNDGEGVAECYGWQGESLLPQSSARISMTMAELSQQGRIVSGTLRDGTPALFVTGVAEGGDAITDILTAPHGELTNIALSDVTGVSALIAPFQGLYPADINNDGVTETPQAVALPPWGDPELELSENRYYRVDWCTYDSTGKPSVALRTYHDTESGWYFQLKEEWTDRIRVSRSAGSDETTTIFSSYSTNGSKPREILAISVLTGANREVKAARGNRFSLSRQPDALYTAELLSGNDGWTYGLTEDEVRASFSLIRPEWTAGDN